MFLLKLKAASGAEQPTPNQQPCCPVGFPATPLPWSKQQPALDIVAVRLGQRHWGGVTVAALLGQRYWDSDTGTAILGQRHWDSDTGTAILGQRYWDSDTGAAILGQ